MAEIRGGTMAGAAPGAPERRGPIGPGGPFRPPGRPAAPGRPAPHARWSVSTGSTRVARRAGR